MSVGGQAATHAGETEHPVPVFLQDAERDQRPEEAVQRIRLGTGFPGQLGTRARTRREEVGKAQLDRGDQDLRHPVPVYQP